VFCSGAIRGNAERGRPGDEFKKGGIRDSEGEVLHATVQWNQFNSNTGRLSASRRKSPRPERADELGIRPAWFSDLSKSDCCAKQHLSRGEWGIPAVRGGIRRLEAKGWSDRRVRLGAHMTTGAQGSNRIPSDVDLRSAIGAFDFPIALVSLDDYTVVALSRSWERHLGIAASSIVGSPIFELLRPEDRPKAAAALEAVRTGEVEFFRVRRRIIPAGDSGEGFGAEWVRSFQVGAKQFALIEAAKGTTEPLRRPLSAFLQREPVEMVIGATDPDWRITVVSNEIENVLHKAPNAVKGLRLTDLVEPRDVEGLRAAGRLAEGDAAVCLAINLRDAAPPWSWAACVLASLAGAEGKGFILLRFEDAPSFRLPPERVAQLERHLWRIAAEVEASGILEGFGRVPDVTRLSKLQMLTVRQWEIVSRLLRGQRVPQIAKELFVSQSTIRNHLGQVFERLGVHSQAELLALLREDAGSD
jgi:DNA-binding CsgD family transcriptional regulator/PAS domain-containing protein